MSDPEILRLAREKAAEINPQELIRAGFLPANGLFFPAVLYPPVVKNFTITEEEFFAGYQVKDPFVIYAHIPFCVNRCHFCHFVTRTGASSNDVDTYLDALEKEMDLYLRHLKLARIPTSAICIGGGTATHMSPKQMERFLSSFTARLDLSECGQFTLDTDPTTISGEDGIAKLKLLLKYGANRITIGAQAFDNDLLKRMNRAHTSEEATASILSAREHGFNNICVDLIYGYPGQTLESWAATIRHVIDLDVSSFQTYELRIRPQSFNDAPIWARHKKSPADFPTVEELAAMKAAAIITANRHGYSDTQYNYLFSRTTGTTSQYHEKKFTRFFDTLGFGVSANNKLGNNIAIKESDSLVRYAEEVAAGRIPFAHGKKGTPDDQLRRAAIYPLRNRRTLLKEEYRARTGKSINDVFGRKITAMKKFGLMEEDGLKLTVTERGYYFVDALCLQFHHPDHMPFDRALYADGELNPYLP
ncbi:MAG: coproporphyrinogen-III oxidase family protein [Candidatus Omnitrophota bacterium]